MAANGGMMTGGGVGTGGRRITPGSSRAGDCAGACGGLEVVCFEAEGSVTNTNWKFVGQGNGPYNTVPNYTYVGDGCGSYDKEVTTTYYGWKVRKCCAFVSCCLLLPVLVCLLLVITGMAEGKVGRANPSPVVNIGAHPHVPALTPDLSNPMHDCYNSRFWTATLASDDVRRDYCCRNFNQGCPTTAPARRAQPTTPEPVGLITTRPASVPVTAPAPAPAPAPAQLPPNPVSPNLTARPSSRSSSPDIGRGQVRRLVAWAPSGLAGAPSDVPSPQAASQAWSSITASPSQPLRGVTFAGACPAPPPWMAAPLPGDAGRHASIPSSCGAQPTFKQPLQSAPLPEPGLPAGQRRTPPPGQPPSRQSRSPQQRGRPVQLFPGPAVLRGVFPPSAGGWADAPRRQTAIMRPPQPLAAPQVADLPWWAQAVLGHGRRTA
uniref:Uncharacterized protein n=1 Tax=Alexandrium monilatum TaxID=311494 RepID=A0A7S4RHL7_9DINO